ncbi:MAG: hypothetical protein QOI30_581 [Mycobacterium sp.]|jgi:hypothetical protein|nr:hypothetical protein [Mycobacterium sp.]MDT5254119.1 hypothetical protein [Mycobacterium sp.]MDT7767588.1 hypothetical protein [Mycobacterium sp.]
MRSPAIRCRGATRGFGADQWDQPPGREDLADTGIWGILFGLPCAGFRPGRA